MPLRHMPQRSLSDFWSALSPCQDIRTLVLPMLTRSPFLPCWYSRGSASVVIPPAIQWWWPSHLHQCLPGDILYETPGRELPELCRTVRGSSKSLGECSLSHCTLHLGCNQHTLWLIHTCSVWATPATHQCLVCEEHTSWHAWVHDLMLFEIRQRPCAVFYWRHKIFFVIGIQWIWRQWWCVQAWNQTACHRCTLVVVESSQLPSLEPSWPGLPIWGLDNFLARQCPCPCIGRQWYSPPSSHSVGNSPK